MSTNSDDWWEDWISGRRSRRLPPYRGFQDDSDEFLRELLRQFEDEFRWISENAPKDLTRERSSKQGTVKEFGPFVYGYTVNIGSDGKPVVREFGNIKPGLPIGRPARQLKSEREPILDIIDEEKTIKVVAELPGVKKEDVQLNTTEDMLTLRVEGETRKYYKEIKLPARVEPNSAKATCTNGVLEVALTKKETEAGKKGFQIKVE